MSHLKERKEKICLNCQTNVIGRYCHVCGQENLEPKETVWHLVQHFFNDITHFDGKFFSTVKYLMKKPGFLSKEYMAGRRMSYLNPIRMYVFTSAIFFIILFSLKRPEDMIGSSEKKEKSQSLSQLKARQVKLTKEIHEETDQEDRADLVKSLHNTNLEVATIKNLYGDSTKKTFSKVELGEMLLEGVSDSLTRAGYSMPNKDSIVDIIRKANNPESKSNWFDMSSENYKTVEEYDSAERALPDSLRDGWLKRAAIHRLITLKEEYREDSRRFKEHLMENIFHSFPKILFVSLPIFAMILNILYFRHKQYLYVDHGIFTIHLYCATFILLLLSMLLGRLEEAVVWRWFHIVANILMFLIVLYMLIYLYKAMRGFYGQGRAKTFVKYFIVCSIASVINMILLMIFLFISVISI